MKPFIAEHKFNLEKKMLDFQLTYKKSKEALSNHSLDKEFDHIAMFIWNLQVYGSFFEKENLILHEISRDLEALIQLAFLGFYKSAFHKLRNILELFSLYWRLRIFVRPILLQISFISVF